MKRRWMILLAVFLGAASFLHASGDYIGPQRTTTTRVRDPEHDSWTCTRAGEPPCHLHHENNPCPDCGGSHPSVEQQLYWCGWVADTCGCSPAWRDRVTSLPPAVVRGDFTCAQPGNAGWCLGGAGLELSAHEPLEGHAITLIEGDPGILCDPDDAPDVACSWAGSMEGARRVDLWAHSTYGDTSEKGGVSWRLDTLPPVPQLVVSGGEAHGAWYRGGPLEVRAGGSDASSGFASGSVSLEGGDWSSHVILDADGVYSFNLQAVDAAGNLGNGSGTVRLDSTSPLLSTAFSGAGGDGGWHRSGGTASASASDTLSGVASIEHQLDGGGWAGGAEVNIGGEGIHTVRWRVLDAAGNRTEASQELRIDITPPIASLLSPQPVEQSWYSGIVHVSGACSDALSGLARCQVSLDGGASWKNMNPEGGTWSLNIDSTKYNRALHIIVRGEDQAGNVSLSSRTALMIDNGGPKVDVPDWWRNSETVPLVIQDGESGIRRAELWIDCGQYGKRRYIWRGGTIPDEFTWDRRVGEVIAPPGEYNVKLEAWDRMGNHRQDAGVVIVPQPPTATSSSTPSSTLTPTPTVDKSSRRLFPTRIIVTETSTPEPEIIVPTGAQSQPSAPESELPGRHNFFPALLSILGTTSLWAGLGASHITDRRYQALRKIDREFRVMKEVSLKIQEERGHQA